MAEDASLDDFLDSDAGSDEPGSTGTGAEDGGRDGERGDGTDPATGETDSGAADDAAPAVTEAGRSTFDWSPDGAACAACGAVVERRWRDEAGMVCEDCKAW